MRKLLGGDKPVWAGAVGPVLGQIFGLACAALCVTALVIGAKTGLSPFVSAALLVGAASGVVTAWWFRTAPHEGAPTAPPAFSRANVGVFERDYVNRTFVCTPEVGRLLGLPVGKVPQTTEEFNASVHPEDCAAFRSSIAAAIYEGRPLDAEFRVTKQDGSVRWLRCDGRVERDASGACTILTGILTDVTEKVLMGNRLAASESLYRKLAESVPGIVYHMDRLPDGKRKLLFISPGVVEVIGVSRADAYNDPNLLLDVVHPEDRAEKEELAGRCMAEESLYDWTGRIVRPDGEVRWIHSVAQPTKKPDGTIEWIGVMLDVTDVKTAEAEHLETKRRLEWLVRSSPVVIYSCSARSPYPITYISENAQELLSISPDECLKDPHYWQRRVHPDDSDAAFHALQAAKLAGGAQIEYRMRLDSGEYRWVRDEMRFATYDGAPAIVGTVVDVTERKTAQDALRLIENRFAAISDASPVGVFMTGPTGSLVYANSRLADITGVPLRSLSGDSLLSLVEPDDRSRVHGALAGKGETSMQCRLQRPDHRTIWFSLKTAPILDGERFLGLVGTVEDVTERHELEIRSEQSRIEAERANQAKSAFISRISHELRTPLHAVMGFAQLLQMGELTEDQRQSVDHIVGSGNHLLNLIQNLLDISRTESGDLQVNVGTISLHPVVDEAVGMLRPLAEARSVLIDVKLTPDDHVSVLADRQRLKQTLINVLSNAIKYNTREGTVTVSCDVRPDGFATLTVRDTGPGIAAEKFERLFTPFDRLGHEATEIEGTGLGLALSKRLVEAMGGTLEIDSDERSGTVVSINLRYAGARRAQAAIYLEGVEPKPEAHGRILLIEDNDANVTLMESVLRARPRYELTVARSGRAGLEAALADRPDLVLLDLTLPDMLGTRLLERIRSEESLRATDVIVISASTDSRQIERARQLGASSVMTKPLDVNDILHAVDAAIGARAR